MLIRFHSAHAVHVLLVIETLLVPKVEEFCSSIAKERWAKNKPLCMSLL
jgi:hypothetical protein